MVSVVSVEGGDDHVKQIKHVMRHWTLFHMRVVCYKGIEQDGIFLTNPQGHRLVLRLREVDAEE